MQRAGSRRGPLRAGELAEAVVLADLTLVLSIISQVLPFLGGALLVIAVVPMAAIAARNRLRVVVVGAIAAATVGFLVLGTPRRRERDRCAALGAVVGGAARRGWGLWPHDRRRGPVPVAARRARSSTVLLWLFSANRRARARPDSQQLARDAARLLWVSDQLSSMIRSGLNFDGPSSDMDDFVNRFLRLLVAEHSARAARF